MHFIEFTCVGCQLGPIGSKADVAHQVDDMAIPLGEHESSTRWLLHYGGVLVSAIKAQTSLAVSLGELEGTLHVPLVDRVVNLECARFLFAELQKASQNHMRGYPSEGSLEVPLHRNCHNLHHNCHDLKQMNRARAGEKECLGVGIVGVCARKQSMRAGTFAH